jgi:hypothetical protein
MNLRIQWPQDITRDPRWQVQLYAISAELSSLPMGLVECAENNRTAQEPPPGDYTVFANIGMPGVKPNLMGQLIYKGKSTLLIGEGGETDSAGINLQQAQ